MTCTAWRLLAALIGFLPAAAHAAEPGGVLPPGKSYVYKHSAGEPQMREVGH